MNELTKSEISNVLNNGTEEEIKHLFDLLSRQRIKQIGVMTFCSKIQDLASKAYIKFVDDIFREKYPDILTEINLDDSDLYAKESLKSSIGDTFAKYENKTITPDKVFWTCMKNGENDSILLVQANPEHNSRIIYGYLNLTMIVIDADVDTQMRKIKNKITNSVYTNKVIKDYIQDPSTTQKINKMIHAKNQISLKQELLKEIDGLNLDGLRKSLEYIKDLKQIPHYTIDWM